MGCNQSKIENEEVVTRCKERRHFMEEAVSARNAFAAAHSSYITCLKNAGAALSDFAHGEVQDPPLASAALPVNPSMPAQQPVEIPPPPPLPPPPPPRFGYFFPAPLQRVAGMPEKKIAKTVGTIVEEKEEEELENDRSLRRGRRSNKSGSRSRNSGRVEEKEARPPVPPPPPPSNSKQQQPERDHVTYHHMSQQQQQSSAWEYFFPSMETIAGTSLNDAEEDTRLNNKEEEIGGRWG